MLCKKQSDIHEVSDQRKCEASTIVILESANVVSCIFDCI